MPRPVPESPESLAWVAHAGYVVARTAVVPKARMTCQRQYRSRSIVLGFAPLGWRKEYREQKDADSR